MLVTLRLQIRFYNIDNKLIIINPGQAVWLDVTRAVAFLNNDTFDIGRDEYILPS